MTPVTTYTGLGTLPILFYAQTHNIIIYSIIFEPAQSEYELLLRSLDIDQISATFGPFRVSAPGSKKITPQSPRNQNDIGSSDRENGINHSFRFEFLNMTRHDLTYYLLSDNVSCICTLPSVKYIRFS